MVDLDTFLDHCMSWSMIFCKSQVPPDIREAQGFAVEERKVTSAIMSQWYWYRYQRDFDRYAKRHLCPRSRPGRSIARNSTAGAHTSGATVAPARIS